MKPLTLAERIALSNQLAHEAFDRRMAEADRITNGRAVAREFYADADYSSYRALLKFLVMLCGAIFASACFWLLLSWFPSR